MDKLHATAQYGIFFKSKEKKREKYGIACLHVKVLCDIGVNNLILFKQKFHFDFGGMR